MTLMPMARLSGFALGFALATQAATAQQTAPAPAAAAPPAAASGMTIYIDPQTGAILSQPAPGTQPLTLSPQEAEAMSTSHEGLVATPSTVPGGGVMVDLQGRFRSPMMAVVGPDGQVKIQHLGEPAEADHRQ